MSEGLSKKQLKELRKLEKMQAKNLEQKNNSVKWIAIAIVSVLFLILFVGIIVVAKNKNNPKTENGKAVIGEGRHVRTISAPETEATDSAVNSKSVTLVEYADIQCPACKAYHPIVKQLVEAYPGQLKVVFKHFPLTSIHPNAMDAAIAAEAAGKQNKFFEFVDIAYEKQGEWAGLPNPDDKFAEYAKEAGADVAKFKADIKDSQLAKNVETEREEGITNGVTGTPSFYLEGERIQNPADLDAFKVLVNEALKGGSSENNQTQPTAIPTATSAPGQLQLQQ